MPRFAVNLSLLFHEQPLLERFEACAQAGFNAVEIQFPYELRIDQIAEQLTRHDQELVLINLPAGNWTDGERGIACHPNRVDEFKKGVALALEYATALGCRQINCLAGIIQQGCSPSDAEKTFMLNLEYASNELIKKDIKLNIEAINTRDVPGFMLHRSSQAFSLIESLRLPNLQFQYDVYHMQIMEGDLLRTIGDNLDRIGHIQIADNPGRHEPGTGEINFPNLFRELDLMQYTGWVSLEYHPLTTTSEGLVWIQPLVHHRQYMQ